MASTLKCPFCGGTLLTSEKKCPHCGGENQQYAEETPRRVFNPKTIEELKEYCAERGMPLLRMRFFVGEDYREPRAFGIYKAGDHRYIVYKNKADGSRAVRYDGPDEAFAVKELFDKLLDECHHRGIYPDGAVSRASGGTASGYGSQSDRPKKRTSLIFIGVIALIILIIVLVNQIQEKNKINEQIERLRNKPYTFDSVRIGNAYYVFDLGSQEVVSSSSINDHANDGYYRSTYYFYPSPETGEYKAKAAEADVAQKGGIYYRDGTWYVYIASERDWKTVAEPYYSEIGRSLEYLGKDWQDTWGVPDYGKSPVQSGYYSHGEDCYYRDRDRNHGTWYAYRKEDEDWEASDCPVKLGIAAESLEYLGAYYGEDMKNGVRSFENSTPYAIQNHSNGYYRLGSRVYYQLAKYEKTKSLTAYYSSYRQVYYHWYTYGQETEPSADGGMASDEWHATTEPETDSLVYMGGDYNPGWLEKWSVTDFKQSAAGMQAYQINGYLKQDKELFYHYKETWYRFDADSNDWEKDFMPAGDGVTEVFLGDIYQAADEPDAADEWDEDWHTTDFKTSTAWATIVHEEEAQAAREAAEKKAAEERRERESRSYSSDYDSWDSSDTDWDSDW